MAVTSVPAGEVGAISEVSNVTNVGAGTSGTAAHGLVEGMSPGEPPDTEKRRRVQAPKRDESFKYSSFEDSDQSEEFVDADEEKCHPFMDISLFVKGSAMVNPTQPSGKTIQITDIDSRTVKSGIPIQCTPSNCSELNLEHGVTKESNFGNPVTYDIKTCNTDTSNDTMVLKMEVEDNGYNSCAIDHKGEQMNCLVKDDSETDSCDSCHYDIQPNCWEKDDSEKNSCKPSSTFHAVRTFFWKKSDYEIESCETNDQYDVQANCTVVDESVVNNCKVSIIDQTLTGSHQSDPQKRQQIVYIKDDPDYVESGQDDLEYEDDVNGDPDIDLVEKTTMKKEQNIVHQVKIKMHKSKKTQDRVKKSKREKKDMIPYKERKIGKMWYRLNDERCTVVNVKFKPYLEVICEDVSQLPGSCQEGISSTGSQLDSSDQPCQNAYMDVVTEPPESRKTNEPSGGKSASRVIYKYRCKVCGYTSKSLSVTRMHISQVEFYEPSMCSECGETLPNSHQLFVHRKLQHEHRHKMRHPCTHEGCTFTSRESCYLKKHIADVHENKRDFPCTWEGCGKWFKKPYALRIHMRIHNDDKPIVCYLCGFRCRQKASLNWHMKTKHPDKSSS